LAQNPTNHYKPQPKTHTHTTTPTPPKNTTFAFFFYFFLLCLFLFFGFVFFFFFFFFLFFFFFSFSLIVFFFCFFFVCCSPQKTLPAPPNTSSPPQPHNTQKPHPTLHPVLICVPPAFTLFLPSIAVYGTPQELFVPPSIIMGLLSPQKCFFLSVATFCFFLFFKQIITERRHVIPDFSILSPPLPEVSSRPAPNLTSSAGENVHPFKLLRLILVRMSGFYASLLSCAPFSGRGLQRHQSGVAFIVQLSGIGIYVSLPSSLGGVETVVP